mmetsp:Transcript_18471/g.20540  ORF Transcript_18471/g.20540 Transcript_18471/m.20540 type:complete len:776 (-) Transcript_18471:60-2387(-)
MRVLVKGGVWKNTEDEILKAAVMKYGKNQWARIASLLARKSAKQCKSRWYEWLDPSIKKTEWSREEEEKLLHLVKLMPCQWRTISPIVRRTAAQCIEKYEELVSRHVDRGEDYDPENDPRRLRVGEIDPNPETKPAVPDPVDMDEDEKEMLHEARARLANTKGKKAKRKAREKQLKDARRLAALQKRRELKAAGIELPSRRRRRKIKGIDYEREIPFFHQPQPGFYDTSDEKGNKPFEFKRRKLSDLEGRRRHEEELKMRRQDRLKERKKLEENLPFALGKKTEDEELTRREKLKLPATQVTDEELRQIQKANYNPAADDDDEDRSQVTKGLVSSYTPVATPGRPGGFGGATPGRGTPLRTPNRSDILAKEAQNIYAMQAAQTPLRGGENPDILDSDFSGVTPRSSMQSTPNPYATPGGVSSSRTPSRTPVRDNMGINDEDEMLRDETMSDRDRHKSQIRSLKAGLASLPKAKNDVEIAIPEIEEEESDKPFHGTSTTIKDALDIEQEMTAKKQAELEEKLRVRSIVMKRDLPRPVSVSSLYIGKKKKGKKGSSVEPSDLIKEEMLRIMGHDCTLFPKKGVSSPVSVDRHEYDLFSSAQMKSARAAIDAELRNVRGSSEIDQEHFNSMWDVTNDDMILLPPNKFALKSKAPTRDHVDALNHSLDLLDDEFNATVNRNNALLKRVGIYHGGYLKRSQALWKNIAQLCEDIEELDSDVSMTDRVMKAEEVAIANRIKDGQERVREVLDIENTLQNQYAQRQRGLDEAQSAPTAMQVD